MTPEMSWPLYMDEILLSGFLMYRDTEDLYKCIYFPHTKLSVDHKPNLSVSGQKWCLTHLTLVPHVGCAVPSHYLNQCWIIINGTLEKIF